MADDRSGVLALAAGDGRQRALRALARLVAGLHCVVIMFFSIGWLLPWEIVHWLVIAGGAGMQLAWRWFDDNCPLTLLERRLADAGGRERTAAPRPNFVSGLLSRILGRRVPEAAANIVTCLVLYASMLICALRLAG